MPRSQSEPPRPLSSEERTSLTAIARAGSDRAERVARAKPLLAAAEGASFAAAARLAGAAPGDGVARFKKAGLTALDRRHAAARPSSMAQPSGSASCGSSSVRLTARWTGPRPGR